MQVTPNAVLKGIVASGADVLPASVLQQAFEGQQGRTLNSTAMTQAIGKIDEWYQDRGIFGQVQPVLPIPLIVWRIDWLLLFNSICGLLCKFVFATFTYSEIQGDHRCILWRASVVSQYAVQAPIFICILAGSGASRLNELHQAGTEGAAGSGCASLDFQPIKDCLNRKFCS